MVRIRPVRCCSFDMVRSSGIRATTIPGDTIYRFRAPGEPRRFRPCLLRRRARRTARSRARQRHFRRPTGWSDAAFQHACFCLCDSRFQKLTSPARDGNTHCHCVLTAVRCDDLFEQSERHRENSDGYYEQQAVRRASRPHLLASWNHWRIGTAVRRRLAAAVAFEGV